MMSSTAPHDLWSVGAASHAPRGSGTPAALAGFRSTLESDCKRSQTASWNMTKHLGVIALGLALALGAATASWAQGNGGAAKKGAGGTAGGGAPAGSYSPPGSGEPDHCFAASPWGYQWVCG